MPENYLGENLIFIISQPRSGSTLLQRVLSGHPDVQSSAETWLMLHPLFGLRDKGIETDYNAHWARTGVQEFLTYYTDGPRVYDDAIRAWAQVIYGNALQRAEKKRFLDKTPRYYFVVPDLYRVFPEAKFIFLIRNPMAVLASELSTYIKDDWRMLSQFSPDLLKAPAMIMDGIDSLGPKAIQIRYESFVAKPAEELSRLCASIGLTYHPEMLNYAQTPAPKGVMADPIGIHRHSRPSATSIDRWKDMTSDPQSRHFAQSYLEALGPEIIGRMGYSYTAISEVLAEPHNSVQNVRIFPWELAIRQESTWNLRQQMAVRSIECMQGKRGLLGLLASAKAGAKLVWRKFRRELMSSAMDSQ